jgi:hypothetical protein
VSLLLPCFKEYTDLSIQSYNQGKFRKTCLEYCSQQVLTTITEGMIEVDKISWVISLKHRTGLGPKVSSISSHFIGNHRYAFAGNCTIYNEVTKVTWRPISLFHYFLPFAAVVTK